MHTLWFYGFATGHDMGDSLAKRRDRGSWVTEGLAPHSEMAAGTQHAMQLRQDHLEIEPMHSGGRDSEIKDCRGQLNLLGRVDVHNCGRPATAQTIGQGRTRFDRVDRRARFEERSGGQSTTGPEIDRPDPWLQQSEILQLGPRNSRIRRPGPVVDIGMGIEMQRVGHPENSNPVVAEPDTAISGITGGR